MINNFGGLFYDNSKFFYFGSEVRITKPQQFLRLDIIYLYKIIRYLLPLIIIHLSAILFLNNYFSKQQILY